MANFDKDSGYIFETLLLSAGHISGKDKFKFVQTDSSRAEFTLYKSLTEASKKFDVLYSVSGFKYGDRENVYICISGVEEADFVLPDDFDFVEVDCAHFVFSARRIDLKVRSNISKSDLEEGFVHQPDDSDYRGTSLSDITSYYNDIVVISFEKQSIYDGFSLERILYYLLAFNTKVSAFQSSRLNSIFQDLFLNVGNVSYANIFISMTSFHKKHAFLEAYRCIEWIYPMPRVGNLKRSIAYNGKVIDLARQCSDDLSWRRKEEDSLSLLVKEVFELDSDLKEYIHWARFMASCEVEAAANRLYKYRNQLVHQFSPEKELPLDEDILEELIFFVLKMIGTLYSKYESELLDIE
ncbi:hypothetical protein [Aeromonas sp. 600479]|uniref:hypothetical protein n=1 Tax=Aeromonas sp. 600479 TaxID=2712028 RepID=UPI003B9EECF8